MTIERTTLLFFVAASLVRNLTVGPVMLSCVSRSFRGGPWLVPSSYLSAFGSTRRRASFSPSRASSPRASAPGSLPPTASPPGPGACWVSPGESGAPSP